jgi:hypothetical protein
MTVKEDVIDRACSKHETSRNGYSVLMGKSEEITRKKTGRSSMDWINLAQDWDQ